MTRNYLLIICVLLLACAISVSGIYPPSQSNETEVAFEKQVGLPLCGAHDSLLYRSAYTVCYDSYRKIPFWVAWHLTADRLSGDQARMSNFSEDPEVVEPRATLADYKGSHYDRGHMCPAGDNKRSYKEMLESFLLTNVCPQDHNLNTGDWNELEMACRRWAKAMGDIYIVAGPVFNGEECKTIGPHKVAVPDAFFKVVLCLQGMPKAIGFLCRNEAGNNPLSDYVFTVDEIEKLTGFDFFPLLPDEIEDMIESQADWSAWQ